MRISDWSSDVCSSDLAVYSPGMGFIMTEVVALTAGTMFLMWVGEQVTERGVGNGVSLIIFAGIVAGLPGAVITTLESFSNEIGRASCRERVCQYVKISGGAVSFKKKKTK